jgi:hypothetical protein
LWFLTLLFPRVLYLFDRQPATAKTRSYVRGFWVTGLLMLALTLALAFDDVLGKTLLASAPGRSGEIALLVVLAGVWSFAYYTIGLPPEWRRQLKAHRSAVEKPGNTDETSA